MPEMITIFFNCGGNGSMTIDPDAIDVPQECEDALMDLISYLEENHISYFHRYINNDEEIMEEEKLIASGAKEIAR